MIYIKTFENYNKKRIEVKDNIFRLFDNDILVAETMFEIETPDEFFNEKYVTIHDLKTYENFRGKGYAKYLLNEFFNYVKNILKFNIITLIVYKDNINAVNLYFNIGFEIYMEYEDSYCLIKRF